MNHQSSYTAPRNERRQPGLSSARSGRGGSYGSSYGRGGRYTPRKKNQLLRTLLYYVLPFVVFNGIIFILVTSRPNVEITVEDTKDYRTTNITFTVKSLLPLKEVGASLESKPLELEQNKRTYTASICQNGTLEVTVKGYNGMQTVKYEHINTLDESGPTFSEEYTIEDDILTITIEDTQSGINYSTLHATDASGRTVTPSWVDKETGAVKFPMDSDTLTVIASDMAGNELNANYSRVKEGLQDDAAQDESI